LAVKSIQELSERLELLENKWYNRLLFKEKKWTMILI
jgi:hypothetical protein